MAQILIGKDSLVSDVYPMHSYKQFVNNLEDNIRFGGDMSKLSLIMLKLKFPTKLKTSSECTTAVVGILNLIIIIKILLSGTIGPSRQGVDQHHPQQD